VYMSNNTGQNGIGILHGKSGTLSCILGYLGCKLGATGAIVPTETISFFGGTIVSGYR
jgi:hypothetical protein